MGMFDTIHCEYPLPEPAHNALEFQTKSLDSCLNDYTITREGRLLRHAHGGLLTEPASARRGPAVECPFHGDLTMYASTTESAWIEYLARFTYGRLDWIRPVELDADGRPIESRPDREAAVPPRLETGDEAALLANLRRDRTALEALLQECSGHWGYEDGVYRFYHQSWKVYGLQDSTRAIVDRLRALVPNRPLTERFEAIVTAGTGKRFAAEHNTRWDDETRPIVEAFFHARYFLEMAVRYAGLDAPPTTLPSGYAALLELFDLR